MNADSPTVRDQVIAVLGDFDDPLRDEWAGMIADFLATAGLLRTEPTEETTMDNESTTSFDTHRKVEELLAEANRTAGQVLAEYDGHTWLHVPPSFREHYHEAAAAVIHFVVGPDRVVVDRKLLTEYRPTMDFEVLHNWAAQVRHEVLS